jgi:hypothetical protein
MGLLSYIKPKKAVKAAPPPVEIALPETPGSLRPASTSSWLGDSLHSLKYEALASYIHQEQQERFWTSFTAGVDHLDQGVVIKKTRDEYACCPEYISTVPNGFASAVAQLNVAVCCMLRKDKAWLRLTP